MRYLYGDSWERFPIEAGEIWQAGTGSVSVNDLFAGMPEFMKAADCIFVDPPYNVGNVNTYYTMAGRSDRVRSFQVFVSALYSAVDQINPATAYVEAGDQNIGIHQAELAKRFKFQQTWKVKYYNKHPCNIVRGSNRSLSRFDYTDLDELKVIRHLAEHEQYDVIGDICMGRGAVGASAFASKRKFVGTELNKRRLAVLLSKIADAGGHVLKL